MVAERQRPLIIGEPGTQVVKTIDRRIRKLEDRFWPGNGKPPLLMVVSEAGRGLALDEDRCVQILRECGFLPAGPVGVVHLGNIPKGLPERPKCRGT